MVAEQEAELPVGLAEELAERPGQRIAEDEDPAEQPGLRKPKRRTLIAITMNSSRPSVAAS